MKQKTALMGDILIHVFFFSHMTVIDGKRIFDDFIIIYYESNLNGWTICELEILEDHKQR